VENEKLENVALDWPIIAGVYPVYMIKQTSSKHRANVKQTSSNWSPRVLWIHLLDVAWCLLDVCL